MEVVASLRSTMIDSLPRLVLILMPPLPYATKSTIKSTQTWRTLSQKITSLAETLPWAIKMMTSMSSSRKHNQNQSLKAMQQIRMAFTLKRILTTLCLKKICLIEQMSPDQLARFQVKYNRRLIDFSQSLSNQ